MGPSQHKMPSEMRGPNEVKRRKNETKLADILTFAFHVSLSMFEHVDNKCCNQQQQRHQVSAMAQQTGFRSSERQ